MLHDPMDEALARLRELRSQIDALAAPDAARSRLERLFGSVLAHFWEPDFSVDELEALMTLASQLAGADTLGAAQRYRLLDQATAALDEFAHNLKQVKRRRMIEDTIPVRYLVWLQDTHAILERLLQVCKTPNDREALRRVGGIDRVRVLPPLDVPPGQDTPPKDETSRDRRGTLEAEDESQAAPYDPLSSTGTDLRVSEVSERAYLRQVQFRLSTIDHLLHMAGDETEFLGRARTLLEATRQFLFELAAEYPLEQATVEKRLRIVRRRIARIDRLEALGIRANAGLLHQARLAVHGGDRDRLHAILVSLDQSARAREDDPTTDVTRAALNQLGGHGALTQADNLASVAGSARKVLGADVAAAVEAGYQRGRRNAVNALQADVEARAKAKDTLEYLAQGTEQSTLAAALAADGCFDVGSPLSPVRVQTFEETSRPVAFPTQDMAFRLAETVDDLPNAVIEDPRLLLRHLAEGKLLARSFLEHTRRPTTRMGTAGEARVYLLDGSSSMLGPRARMRDAILVAELATLARRLKQPDRQVRTVLYYRYFAEAPGPTTRVHTAAAALAAISDVLATSHAGETDIEKALLSSFELIRTAEVDDPDLARAQIVLITDGEAPVNEARIRKAREALGALPVGVSVIALGQQNPALRQIVARERARGERAFYQFIDDEELQRIHGGDIDDGPALIPKRASDAPATPEDLEAQVGALLDELETLGRDRATEAVEADAPGVSPEADLPAYLKPLVSGTGSARKEALARDHRAISRRFDRWFPDLKAPADATFTPPDADSVEADHLETTLALVATVLEIVERVEGSELFRRADAIDLIERLLPEAGLSPTRYAQMLERYPQVLGPALRSVRAATRWGVAWRLKVRRGAPSGRRRSAG